MQEAHQHFACFANTFSAPEGLDAAPTIASTPHQAIASIIAHAHYPAEQPVLVQLARYSQHTVTAAPPKLSFFSV
jgi:hypothetical protein